MSINGHDLKVPLIGRGEDEEVGGVRSTAVPAASSKHSLGFGALVFLIYYNIGVPFGDEEVRLKGGDVLCFFLRDRGCCSTAIVGHMRYCHTMSITPGFQDVVWGCFWGWYLTSTLSGRSSPERVRTTLFDAIWPVSRVSRWYYHPSFTAAAAPNVDMCENSRARPLFWLGNYCYVRMYVGNIRFKRRRQ